MRHIVYTVPMQFCPECGLQVLSDISDHNDCIAWGVKMGKYRSGKCWIEACKKNGERVLEILPIHVITTQSSSLQQVYSLSSIDSSADPTDSQTCIRG
jgi:hypothetical protein